MQLSRQVQVGEADDQRLAPVHFFAIYQHLVTPGGHLQRAKGEIRESVMTGTRTKDELFQCLSGLMLANMRTNMLTCTKAFLTKIMDIVEHIRAGQVT